MTKIIILILFFSIVFRLFLIPVAYHGDLNNNISWGEEVYNRGLNGFYGSEKKEAWPYSAPNQPPLYILLFSVFLGLYEPLNTLILKTNETISFFPSAVVWFWEESGKTLLVKLPGILADIGIGYLIYHYFKKKEAKKGVFLSLLWLLNPVSWYNSSVWGQTDTIVNFFGLLSVFALLKKKLIAFAFWFTVSLLFKGSLAIFIPILGIYALIQKYPYSTWLKALFVSIGVIVVSSVWFHPNLDLFGWLLSLYKNRLLPGEIDYLTANAFNVWWLVDPGKTADSALFFGISAKFIGYIIPLITYTLLSFWIYKKPSEKKLFFSLALSAIVTFLFMTRIHERYLFPLFPIGTVIVGIVPAFITPFIVLSFLHIFNLYHLFYAPPITQLISLYDKPLFPVIVAVLQIILFILIFYKHVLKRLN